MPSDPPSQYQGEPLAGPPTQPLSGGLLTFDVANGRIVSIDHVGRRRLGLLLSETGAGLDAQMPALVRLRELARTGLLLDGPLNETLVFWSSSGAKRIKCKISQSSAVLESGRGIQVEFEGETPAPVKDRNGHTHAAADHPAPDHRPADEDDRHEDETRPPRVRDDAATLSEIRNQIRNGMRSSPDIAELAAANDRVPLPDYLAPPSLDNGGAQTASPKRVPRSTEVPNTTNKSDRVLNDPIQPKSDFSDTSDASTVLSDADLASRLSRAAHEIKTPLSAIAAAAEVIRDEHLGPGVSLQYRSYAEGIQSNARHALDVVDRILKEPRTEEPVSGKASAIARVPTPARPSTLVTGKLATVATTQQPSISLPKQAAKTEPADLTPVNINTIIDQIAHEMGTLAGYQGVRISAWPDANVETRLMSATSFKQAILNLVTNALKFTSEGGTIMIESQYVPGHAATVSVRDTGYGMTRAMAARLMDPSLDKRASRKTLTGHGLGFEQIREFVAEHGGRLQIDSTLGKGTCVTIIFPTETANL
jgi:two-component system, cell cycle sensor histidine kinase PleC